MMFLEKLFLVVGLVFFNRLVDFVLNLVHAFLEAAHALADAFHQFRNFLSAEKKQDNENDNDYFSCADIQEI